MSKFDEIYKAEATKVIDDLILRECHVKLALPSCMGDILLQLAQGYAETKSKMLAGDDIIT